METLERILENYEQQNNEDGSPAIFPRYLAFGDYVGCFIERSNQDVFLEEFGSLPGITVERSWYGSKRIGITLDLLRSNTEIQDCLDGLLDYPLLDEFHYSKICMDDYLDQWNEDCYIGWIDDLRHYKKISWNANDLLLDYPPDLDDAMRIFEESIPSGEYWIDECSSQLTICTDYSAQRISRDALASLIKLARKHKQQQGIKS